jgi:hypothetical protein
MAKKGNPITKETITVDLLGTGDSTTIAVISANTVYTNAIRIDDSDNMVASVKQEGMLGSNNTTVTVEQSFQSPTTQYSPDITYVQVTSLYAALATQGTWHSVKIPHIALPYLRFNIAGAALNSSATVAIKLSRQIQG